MRDFIIRETNFGVSTEASRCGVVDGLLTVEIRGDEQIYEELTADEDSPWSWTLYPPFFYLRGYPVPGPAFTLPPDTVDDYDLALYMMAHYDVSDVRIEWSTARIQVTGTVDMGGKLHPFRIDYGAQEARAEGPRLPPTKPCG